MPLSMLPRCILAGCILCQAIIGTSFGQGNDQPVQRASDMQQRLSEIQALQIRINDKLSQMNAVAGLSAHGPRDPTVNLMAVEIRQLQQLLAQQTAQLEQRYAERRRADVDEVLRAHQVAREVSQPSPGEQLRQQAASPWRMVELNGQKYYLIPVAEIDGPAATAKRKSRIITPSAGPARH